MLYLSSLEPDSLFQFDTIHWKVLFYFYKCVFYKKKKNFGIRETSLASHH